MSLELLFVYFISTLTLPTPSAPTLLPYTENLDTHLLQWLHQELLSSITHFTRLHCGLRLAAECGNENHFSHILERTGYLKPAAGKAFLKSTLKKIINQVTTTGFIWMSAFQKIMKIWFMPTNAGNLLLLLWCCCLMLLLLVFTLKVRVSDFPGDIGHPRRGKVGWAGKGLPQAPLAGCVTFAKSHSPLWASAGFWNEGVELIPKFLRALKSNELYQELWLGARLWNTTSSAELESRIPVRLDPPEWQTFELSHPHRVVGSGSLPLLRCPKGCTQQPVLYSLSHSPPTHPAQCLLIKCSSSKKMGGAYREEWINRLRGRKRKTCGGVGRPSIRQRGVLSVYCWLALPEGEEEQMGWTRGDWSALLTKIHTSNLLWPHSEGNIPAPEDWPWARSDPVLVFTKPWRKGL